MATNERLRSIQILRGCAALMVVLQHSSVALFGVGTHEDFFNTFCFTGVDLFFLISGFIFMRMASRKFDFTLFVKNRFRRIYPSYWTILAIILIAHALGATWEAGVFPQTASTLARSFALFPQDYGRVFTLAWTLEIEMIFYTLFAVLAGTGRRGWLVPLLLALGAMGLVAPQWTSDHIPGAPLWNYPYTFIFMVEFAAGALVYTFAPKLRRLGVWLPLAAGLVVYAVSVWKFIHITDPLAMRIVRIEGMSVAFALIMIAALNAEESLSEKNFFARAGVWLGEISYSLYLSHWLVFSALASLRLDAIFASTAARELARIASIAMAVGAAALFYRTVERPLSHRSASRTRDNDDEAPREAA